MKFFVIIKEKSIRVPNKNFIKIGDTPLWERLINTLEGQEVYIDTDSSVVLQKSKKYKWVNAYPRLQEHIDLENNDKFGVSPVLLMIERFLNEYVQNDNEIIVTPHVTSPFITLETILNATKKLNEGFESVQACTEHKEFAYFNKKPINFNEDRVPKTQDLPPIILGNGAFFVFHKKTFFKYNNRVSPNRFFYPLNFIESVEIDTMEDLEIAKKLAT